MRRRGSREGRAPPLMSAVLSNRDDDIQEHVSRTSEFLCAEKNVLSVSVGDDSSRYTHFASSSRERTQSSQAPFSDRLAGSNGGSSHAAHGGGAQGGGKPRSACCAGGAHRSCSRENPKGSSTGARVGTAARPRRTRRRSRWRWWRRRGRRSLVHIRSRQTPQVAGHQVGGSYHLPAADEHERQVRDRRRGRPAPEI